MSKRGVNFHDIGKFVDHFDLALAHFGLELLRPVDAVHEALGAQEDDLVVGAFDLLDRRQLLEVFG